MEKKYIIKSYLEYQRVYSNKNSYGNKNLVLYKKKNNLGYSRIGITITKKIGNAVTRNKIRRRLKEICRNSFDSIEPGYDLVFVVKSNVPSISFKKLESAFMHILKISDTLIR